VSIPSGSLVMPLLGSANRDEARFPDPNRFDVARDTQGHLAFGLGIHFCLGASLARLEARVALEELLARYPGFEHCAPRVQNVDSYVVRGPKRLPVRLTA
jgi:cytochrome P450